MHVPHNHAAVSMPTSMCGSRLNDLLYTCNQGVSYPDQWANAVWAMPHIAPGYYGFRKHPLQPAQTKRQGSQPAACKSVEGGHKNNKSDHISPRDSPPALGRKLCSPSAAAQPLCVVLQPGVGRRHASCLATQGTRIVGLRKCTCILLSSAPNFLPQLDLGDQKWGSSPSARQIPHCQNQD